MTELDDSRDAARGLGAELAELSREAKSFTGSFSSDLRDVSQSLRGADTEARQLSRSLGTSLGNAFDRLVFGGGALSDVLRQLGRDMSSRVFNSALKPIESAVGNGLGALVGGGFGALAEAFSPFAGGGAFSAGRVRAFAGGGVVDGPTAFPMRGGTGLMGEAGPEAIMPLTRGPDGKLGVAARSGGGTRVSVNIAARDVESFRRSRSQVAGALARAVRAGQGRL